MCGIAGYISFYRPVENLPVEKMLEQMVHRGPDDFGLYEDTKAYPQAVLGHRRLSILDLSQAGHQPMTNEDGTLWIVFNGEIYNYPELRKDLLAKGHTFNSATDTEAILHLYEEYGSECVMYLRGMFAFAIWDGKRRTFFLARDRVGKKPLYYAQFPGGFCFASEIQALYPLQEIGRSLDWTALDLFFTHSYIPSPHTIYKEIKKLPPASTLLVENEELAIKKYWSLNFTPKLAISFSEAKEQLLFHIEEATRIRLCSDVPLGCFLSGGVDSSTIVAMMARCSTSPVKTFSIGFSEKEFDETSYARTVAAFYKTDHHEFQVEPRSIEVLPELIRHYGEPFADSSALPTWYLSAMTCEHVTVVLNGDGGDESFAGYNWYQTGTALASLSRFCPDMLTQLLHRMIPSLFGKRGGKVIRLLQLLAKDHAHRFADLRTDIKSSVRRDLYIPEILMNAEQTVEQYLVNLYAQCEGVDELDRMLWTDIMAYLPEELLVKVDRATMAHSLEARSPFLDHRLMEFAARLPSQYKLRGRNKKHVLVEAVAPLFPEGFLNRPKMGFSVPLQSWFCGDLKGYVEDRIFHGEMARSGNFNIPFLRQLVEGQVPKLRDTSSLIWRLLVFAEWTEQYG